MLLFGFELDCIAGCARLLRKSDYSWYMGPSTHVELSLLQVLKVRFMVLKSMGNELNSLLSLLSFHISTLSLQLLLRSFSWLSHHHIHPHFFVGAREPDLLSQAVTHLPVDLDIDVMGTLEITWLSSLIRLCMSA